MRTALALARQALATEGRMYVGAARRPDVPEGTEPVRYVGSVAVLLWAITAVSTVELVALHLIIPWHAVRVVADVLGIWGVVWCVGYTGCHYVYPHLATDAGLRLRAMQRGDTVLVPWAAIETVRVRERSLDSSRAVQVDDGVASLVVAKMTTLELVLRPPVGIHVRGVTHEVHEVRVAVDEPRRTADLIRRRMGSGARGAP